MLAVSTIRPGEWPDPSTADERRERRIAEVRQVTGDKRANEMLAEGWELFQAVPVRPGRPGIEAATYVMVRYEDGG